MKNKIGLAVLLEQNKVISIRRGIPDFSNTGSTAGGSSSSTTYTKRFDPLVSVVNGKPPYEKGQQSEFIQGPKQQIGHTDTNEYFDDAFEAAIRKYQSDEKITITGKLDRDTICRIYPKICGQVSQNKGTQSPKVVESQITRVLKPYLSRFRTGEKPSKDNCNILIDNYAGQAKLYRQNKEVGNEDKSLTADQLTPFKSQIRACFRIYPILRLKIRDVAELKRQESPFYLLGDLQNTQDNTNQNNTSVPNKQDRPVRMEKLGNANVVTDFLTEFYGLTRDKKNKPIETRINRLVKVSGNYLEFNALVGDSEDFEKFAFDCDTKEIYGSIEDESGYEMYSLNRKGFGEFKNYCKTLPEQTAVQNNVSSPTSTPAPSPQANTANNTMAKTQFNLPERPNDVSGFQKWLDETYPTWYTGNPAGSIPGRKLGRNNYGNFGDNTKKAWTQYGKEYIDAGLDKELESDWNWRS